MNKRFDLPQLIASYFAADKLDGEAVARCYTNDAVVKDEGRTCTGLEAIKRWRAECRSALHAGASDLARYSQAARRPVCSLPPVMIAKRAADLIRQGQAE